MRTVILHVCKKEKLILLFQQYFHCITVIATVLSSGSGNFRYLYYFVEGALCIPWKHTSQDHQGKSPAVIKTISQTKTSQIFLTIVKK